MTSQAVSPIHEEPHAAAALEEWPEDLQQDRRWLLTLRVVRGHYFVRAPLLSKFLLHIVGETLEDRKDQITEHQIGVQVFSRPASYRTVEDNIVRNYARQLRRRLTDHFAANPEEAMCIEVPLGGYVPVFTMRDGGSAEIETLPTLELTPAEAREDAVPRPPVAHPDSPYRRWPRVLFSILALTAYSALLIGLTRLVVHKPSASAPDPEADEILWQTLLNGTRNTYIVPPDAGFNLVEDLTHHPVPLADYIQGGYAQIPLPRFDEHSAQDIRVHEFTDFVDLQIISSLMRLRAYNPQRVSLRFPRDLTLDDLKNSNAVIIGSVCSNPWASLADPRSNFSIVCSEGMRSSSIVNKAPHSGEEKAYVSHWNEPTHTTYALIRLVPNLSGDGHLLLLEGLDVAGTQAAAEALLHSDAVEHIVQQAVRADRTLGYFEILLRSTSIESNATGTEVIASRIHQAANSLSRAR